MKLTDSNRQTVSRIEQHLGQPTDPSRGEASNVILFPDTRTSREQPKNTTSRTLNLQLHQAVGKVKAAVLRFISTAYKAAVQGRRESTTASAGHDFSNHLAPANDHHGRPIRNRMSG